MRLLQVNFIMIPLRDRELNRDLKLLLPVYIETTLCIDRDFKLKRLMVTRYIQKQLEHVSRSIKT